MTEAEMLTLADECLAVRTRRLQLADKLAAHDNMLTHTAHVAARRRETELINAIVGRGWKPRDGFCGVPLAAEELLKADAAAGVYAGGGRLSSAAESRFTQTVEILRTRVASGVAA